MNMKSVTTHRTALDPSLRERESRPPPQKRSAAAIAALLLGFSATVVSAQPEMRIIYGLDVLIPADVFDLGEVRLYDQEHVQFAIHNFGDASLEFIGTPRVEIVELSEGDEADFRAQLKTPEVAPGGLALLDLWFRPSSRGDREIEITVRSNDAELPNFTFTVWASGVAPLINVSSDRVPIRDGETLDIGEVWMGEVLEVELAIENLGNAPLMLAGEPEQIEFRELGDGSSEDFEAILQAALIAPGASAPLLIVLDPASAGKRVVELVIPSNDPDHAQYVFRLEVLVHEAEGEDEDSDCNANSVLDLIDVASHESEDCDGNGVPDECQQDSDSDGVIDACEEDHSPPDDDPQEDPDGDGDGDGGPDDPGDGIGDGGGSDEDQDSPQGQDDSDDQSPGGGVDDPDGDGSRNRGICGIGTLGMLPMMMLGLMGMRYRRGR